ncbi:TPA: DUF3696 domain-containing protein [Pseudomonas aeruginosa]|uniref:AAA family ATPase n=1 Tax=Pseudomonas aeruginosa TaxID=287 RepID=UPI000F51EF0E|nr:DUF3696 domain-containing protein [Pseudomonas aeruginosa]MBG5531466.1 DUF3696 domain-containing protein [Pseudomonas aeruginosa]MBG7404846.1 DUF3696 domain-containing protein [Pseudomonas aeruginosa]RPS34255.1 hypothetical protein IPC1008_30480 [Pseudomonas aeruginosa]HBO3766131.1 DUF3696 domain-containing protein [Pseudomonas aeruginosa]HCU2501405.1 DUF3696 domain-containing protein [Pseudomonas aeruginosa]
MLDYIRIKNLRSLEDTKEVYISPITVLLGENSSGKSTFLRTFPLLKQSVETNTRSPVLWYGKYVDFGDFDQALSRNNESKEISFIFGLTVPKMLVHSPKSWRRAYRTTSEEATLKVIVEIRLTSRGKDGLTRTAGLALSIEDNVIDIGINEQGRVSKIQINDIDYSSYADLFSYTQAVKLLPNIFAKQDEPNLYRWRTRPPPEKLRQQILRMLSEYMHGKSGEKALSAAYSNIRAGSQAQMYFTFRKASSTLTWSKRTSTTGRNTKSVRELLDLVLLSRVPEIIFAIDEVLDATFRRVSYTAPLRASAERYYRSQDLSVAELDAKGENLTMFVRNLSEREKQQLDSWTRREFGFKLEVKYSGGHVTAGIEYEGSGESFNLTDMGFGFSQVMPIIVQVWTLIYRANRLPEDEFVYTYVIEQPELHLHPRLQAKLAEALITAVTQARKHAIKINLVLETHSEAIINKIGLMAASEVISPSDVNIIIFSKETERTETKVSVSNFDENGVLINWPYGFFDIEV